MAIYDPEVTHEIDHRYLVLGYVWSGAGRAVLGAPVEVVRERTGLAYQEEADEDGFYLVVVHLHDEDAGEGLRVTVASGAMRIPARFDPGDARSHRGTRVDFSDVKATDGSRCSAGRWSAT